VEDCPSSTQYLLVSSAIHSDNLIEIRPQISKLDCTQANERDLIVALARRANDSTADVHAVISNQSDERMIS